MTHTTWRSRIPTGGAEGAGRGRALERDGAGRTQRLRARGTGRVMEYVPRRLEEYAERFTTVHSDVFDRLRDETSALPNAGMSVGPLEGAFLSFMVFLKQPRHVLEIG